MSRRQVLRWLALAGVAVVVGVETVRSFPPQPRQEWGLLVLLLAPLAVALIVRLLLPAAGGRLLRHPDLLVPLGLLAFAEAALRWAQLVPGAGGLLTASWPLNILGIGLSLSAGFVGAILLRVVYAAWMTTLVLDGVRAGQADPVEALRGLRWLPRVFLLELLGWVGLFVGVALAIALGPAALTLAIMLIGVWSLAWNLCTSALLLVALDDQLRLWDAITHGLRVSWGGVRRWGLVVVAQLVLLGAATFYSLSYSETGPGGYTTHTQTNWSVNGFWTGGYEDECRWYGTLMQTAKAPLVPVIGTLLGLVFGTLAIAVKLHIADRLPGMLDKAPEPVPNVPPDLRGPETEADAAGQFMPKEDVG